MIHPWSSDLLMTPSVYWFLHTLEYEPTLILDRSSTPTVIEMEFDGEENMKSWLDSHRNELKLGEKSTAKEIMEAAMKIMNARGREDQGKQDQFMRMLSKIYPSTTPDATASTAQQPISPQPTEQPVTLRGPRKLSRTTSQIFDFSENPFRVDTKRSTPSGRDFGITRDEAVERFRTRHESVLPAEGRSATSRSSSSSKDSSPSRSSVSHSSSSAQSTTPSSTSSGLGLGKAMFPGLSSLEQRSALSKMLAESTARRLELANEEKRPDLEWILHRINRSALEPPPSTHFTAASPGEVVSTTAPSTASAPPNEKLMNFPPITWNEDGEDEMDVDSDMPPGLDIFPVEPEEEVLSLKSNDEKVEQRIPQPVELDALVKALQERDQEVDEFLAAIEERRDAKEASNTEVRDGEQAAGEREREEAGRLVRERVQEWRRRSSGGDGKVDLQRQEIGREEKGIKDDEARRREFESFDRFMRENARSSSRSSSGSRHSHLHSNTNSNAQPSHSNSRSSSPTPRNNDAPSTPARRRSNRLRGERKRRHSSVDSDPDRSHDNHRDDRDRHGHGREHGERKRSRRYTSPARLEGENSSGSASTSTSYSTSYSRSESVPPRTSGFSASISRGYEHSYERSRSVPIGIGGSNSSSSPLFASSQMTDFTPIPIPISPTTSLIPPLSFSRSQSQCQSSRLSTSIGHRGAPLSRSPPYNPCLNAWSPIVVPRRPSSPTSSSSTSTSPSILTSKKNVIRLQSGKEVVLNPNPAKSVRDPNTNGANGGNANANGGKGGGSANGVGSGSGGKRKFSLMKVAVTKRQKLVEKAREKEEKEIAKKKKKDEKVKVKSESEGETKSEGHEESETGEKLEEEEETKSETEEREETDMEMEMGEKLEEVALVMAC